MICSHLLRCRLLGLLLLLCWGSSLEAQDYYRAEEPSRCDSSVYTDRLGIRLLGQGFSGTMSMRLSSLTTTHSQAIGYAWM